METTNTVEKHPNEDMSAAEVAFWGFYAAANSAGLNATECAKILGISRTNWYFWIAKKNTPYERRAARMNLAAKHLRADLAEKILPALTGPVRRKIVADLVEKLNKQQEADDAEV